MHAHALVLHFLPPTHLYLPSSCHPIPLLALFVTSSILTMCIVHLPKNFVMPKIDDHPMVDQRHFTSSTLCKVPSTQTDERTSEWLSSILSGLHKLNYTSIVATFGMYDGLPKKRGLSMVWLVVDCIQQIPFKLRPDLYVIFMSLMALV